VQAVTLGEWGILQVFGVADSGTTSAPSLPRWLPVTNRYHPARLTLRAPAVRHLDFVAVWPGDLDVHDPDGRAAWTIEQLDGVLLARPTELFHCAACGKRVNALRPETGLPFFREFGRHRWATACPYCATHVDGARLHALALFTTGQDLTGQ
jgi:hypothetical protein